MALGRSHSEHPENDLRADADSANLPRPVPRDFDELADAPDPLEEARRNQASTRQAIWWAAGTVLGTFVVAFLLAIPARLAGGELCEVGTATWICSRAAEIWWPIATSIVPVGGVIGCAIMLYRKYINYTRWRPWMGAFWILVPWSMLWMTTVGQMLIVGH